MEIYVNIYFISMILSEALNLPVLRLQRQQVITSHIVYLIQTSRSLVFIL